MSKKFIILTALLLSVLMLSACESDPGTPTGANAEPQSNYYDTDGSFSSSEQSPLDVGVNTNGYWSASLFSRPATEYNNDLALFGAHLAANSTWSWQISDYFESCGFNAYEHYNYESDKSDSIDNRYYGTNCFAIGHDVLMINGEETVVLVIAVRGSVEPSEFAGDYLKKMTDPIDHYEKRFNHTSRICNNIYDFYEQVHAGIDKYLHKYEEVRFAKNIKIFVCGHSLGGATANLVAVDFNNGEWFAERSINDIYAYTYGAIQVIYLDTPNISDGYENIHNVFNYYDSFGEHGAKSAIGASSYYSKFGHTEIFKSEAFHKSESTLGDTPNHNIEIYIEALEYEKTNPGMLIDLACDPSHLKKGADLIDDTVKGDTVVPPGTYVNYVYDLIRNSFTFSGDNKVKMDALGLVCEGVYEIKDGYITITYTSNISPDHVCTWKQPFSLGSNSVFISGDEFVKE